MRSVHVLVGVGALGLITLSACGEPSAERPVPPAPTVAPQTAAPLTTVASATTAVPITVPPSTDVAPTDAPTTVPPPTTGPPTTPAPPLLALNPTGVGLLAFGVAADEVLNDLILEFGTPDEDSGWEDPIGQFGVCPGVQARGVRWGALLALFSQDPPEGGDFQRFFSYIYGGGSGFPEGPALTTRSGIGLGSTVARIREAHPEVSIVEDELFGTTWVLESGLSGTVTDATDAGTVTAIFGGPGCGE